jgi:hypothetical protein
MKNEKELSKGHGTATRHRKATTPAQTIGRMGIGTQQANGRRGNRPQQSAPRTIGHPALNFLKTKFLPMYTPEAQTPQDSEVGRGVKNSLAILAGELGIKPMDVSALPYPYNVLIAHEQAKQQLRRTHWDLELFIMEAERAICNGNDGNGEPPV